MIRLPLASVAALAALGLPPGVEVVAQTASGEFGALRTGSTAERAEAASEAKRRESTADVQITVSLPGGVELVMLRIPPTGQPGTFTMGSPDDERGRYAREGPQHQVTISQPFYLGMTEVTQAQWAAVVGTAMPTECGSHGVGDTYPVYCVSWEDVAGAGGFLEKLNQHAGTSAFRLPTEAEWEYAARAGTTTRFSFGDALECKDSCVACATFEQYMWWCGNAFYHTSTPGTRPVAQKLANPWGLFDMHGNVWEWVADYFDGYEASPQTDPAGPAWAQTRVMRGGGWGYYGWSCRSARRAKANPDGYPYRYLGFRLAMSQ